jgi:hypothetical protein
MCSLSPVRSSVRFQGQPEVRRKPVGHVEPQLSLAGNKPGDRGAGNSGFALQRQVRNVHLLVVLHDPAGGFEQTVDLLPGLLFGRHWRSSGLRASPSVAPTAPVLIIEPYLLPLPVLKIVRGFRQRRQRLSVGLR